MILNDFFFHIWFVFIIISSFLGTLALGSYLSISPKLKSKEFQLDLLIKENLRLIEENKGLKKEQTELLLQIVKTK